MSSATTTTNPPSNPSTFAEAFDHVAPLTAEEERRDQVRMQEAVAAEAFA